MSGLSIVRRFEQAARRFATARQCRHDFRDRTVAAIELLGATIDYSRVHAGAASQIASAFPQIGTEISKLRVAK